MLPQTFICRAGGRRARFSRDEQPDLVEICDKYSLLLSCRGAAQAAGNRGAAAGAGRPELRADGRQRRGLSVGWPVARAFARWYMRHLYGPPFDAHIANSEYTADELRRSLWDRAANFIRVCPMGVDVDEFGPSTASATLRRQLLTAAGGTRGSVLLSLCGPTVPEKNVGTADRDDRASFATASDGGRIAITGWCSPATVRWLALVRRCSVRCRVACTGRSGQRTAPQLARYYASADVFVHPKPA